MMVSDVIRSVLFIISFSHLDLVEVVQHLHKHRIIHCDLKSDNILIKQKPVLQVKVIDFGLAEYALKSQPSYLCMEETEILKEKMKLEPSVAPEIHCNYPSWYTTDVFGLGYCLGVLFKRNTTFYNDYRELHRIIRNCRMFDPEDRTDLKHLHSSLKNVLVCRCSCIF